MSFGVDRQLDPRYIPLQRVVGLIVTLVIAGGALIGLLIVLITQWPPLAISLLLLLAWMAGAGALAWLSYRWPEVEYRYTSYRVDADNMEIRHGVYWRSVTNIPRSRVQHTDVSQGPLERRFGLGTLIIHTAGTQHARVDLPGLAHEDALHVRDLLLPRGAPDAV